MNKKYNILLIFGGGGNEHEISILSKEFYKTSLQKHELFNIIEIEIAKNKTWLLKSHHSKEVFLNSKKELCDVSSNQAMIKNIDYVFPCIHGAPGETGQLQGLLDIYQIPYFGNGVEVSSMAMNKITTKLWLQYLNVAVVEFMTLTSLDNLEELKNAEKFFTTHKHIFVKASSEGSSVGVYSVSSQAEFKTAIENAFKLSPYVLLERAIKGREIEVSTYHYNKEIIATKPGEISFPGTFYDYQQKYSADSKATTTVLAKNLSNELVEKIQATCIKIFRCLKFKDLARIDFFLEENGKFYVNEINTFPGSTPISLFPQMMIHHGHDFSEYLRLAVIRDLENGGITYS